MIMDFDKCDDECDGFEEIQEEKYSVSLLQENMYSHIIHQPNYIHPNQSDISQSFILVGDPTQLQNYFLINRETIQPQAQVQAQSMTIISNNKNGLDDSCSSSNIVSERSNVDDDAEEVMLYDTQL